MSLFSQLHIELSRLATAWENASAALTKQANELRAADQQQFGVSLHNDQDIQAAHYTARSKELRDVLKRFSE
jgi:hypothetical protein